MSGKFHWMQMNSPARITRSTAKRVMESGGGIADKEKEKPSTPNQSGKKEESQGVVAKVEPVDKSVKRTEPKELVTSPITEVEQSKSKTSLNGSLLEQNDQESPAAPSGSGLGQSMESNMAISQELVPLSTSPGISLNRRPIEDEEEVVDSTSSSPTKSSTQIGQVVVWGDLYEELCRQMLAEKRMQGVAASNAQVEDALVTVPSDVKERMKKENGEEGTNNETVEGVKTTKRVTRKKRDPELMTKAEHLRILRSALKNTIKLMEEKDGSQRRIGTRSMTRRCMQSASGGDENTESGYNSVQQDGNQNGEQLQKPRRKRSQEGATARANVTYTELLEAALNENPDGMTVSQIYEWISAKNEAFPMEDSRWKNSVRHNLSINTNFQKSTKSEGKAGRVWTLSKNSKGPLDEENGENATTEAEVPVKKPRRQYRRKAKLPEEQHSVLNQQFDSIIQDLNGSIVGSIKPEPGTCDQDLLYMDASGTLFHGGSGYSSYLAAKPEHAEYLHFPDDNNTENSQYAHSIASSLEYFPSDFESMDGGYLMAVDNLGLLPDSYGSIASDGSVVQLMDRNSMMVNPLLAGQDMMHGVYMQHPMGNPEMNECQNSTIPTM